MSDFISIEQGWVSFRKNVYRNVDDSIKLEHLKSSFYAGAIATINIITGTDKMDEKEANIIRLSLNEELEKFHNYLKRKKYEKTGEK